jgi:hypothetical protein
MALPKTKTERPSALRDFVIGLLLCCGYFTAAIGFGGSYAMTCSKQRAKPAPEQQDY